MTTDPHVVRNLVPCSTCRARRGTYCRYRTGPYERIGRHLKHDRNHPARDAEAHAVAHHMLKDWLTLAPPTTTG